jgi:positive regulator of sigma E activity
MNDSLNAITVSQFKTTLIISEIVITAIVLVGFFIIFNKFSKKTKSIKKVNNILLRILII